MLAISSEHSPACIFINSEYVDVIINSNVKAVSRPYTYKIPQDLLGKLQIGYQVEVSFGKRITTAFVVAPNTNGHLLADKIKEILRVVDDAPLVSKEMFDLARWLAARYAATFWEALRVVLPKGVVSGKKIKPKLVRQVKAKVPLSELIELARSLSSRAKKQAAFLFELKEKDGTAFLNELPDITIKTLDLLVEKGVLEYNNIEVRRNPYLYLGLSQSKSFQLNSEQKIAVEAIKESIQKNQTKEFLLFGVTGSGKTEVYLEAISEAIKFGKESIVLVPEISLSCLVAERVKARFGDQVAILHSRLSEGERQDEWRQIASGQVKIAVGARSVLFAPFKSLGLIVIDEEHDGAYKQELSPRYDAREAARKRAELSNSVIILGSATPSLETMAKVKEKKSTVLYLNKRVDGRVLPQIKVVDLKEEQPMEGLFSPTLLKAMEERLRLNQQIILFINRRGFATTVLCKVCGTAIKCRFCSVSLILHALHREVRCHYCDYREPVPGICPNCQSFQLDYKGIGTEKAEEVLNSIFPDVKIIRMDRDTTAQKGSHGEILQKFARREASILIGTQMVTKGFDFPFVTLVGVINADTSLNFPDFRATERGIQLLLQVSGRSGRGNMPGEVILQTYSPNHPAIVGAATHQYEFFLENEFAARQELEYPPFTHLIRVIVASSDPVIIENKIKKLALSLKCEDHKGIIGPAPAPIERLRGKYRWHFFVKIKDEETAGETGKMIQALWESLRLKQKGVSLFVDVDPINLL